jgi:hypothetical protein
VNAGSVGGLGGAVVVVVDAVLVVVGPAVVGGVVVVGGGVVVAGDVVVVVPPPPGVPGVVAQATKTRAGTTATAHVRTSRPTVPIRLFLPGRTRVHQPSPRNRRGRPKGCGTRGP